MAEPPLTEEDLNQQLAIFVTDARAAVILLEQATGLVASNDPRCDAMLRASQKAREMAEVLEAGLQAVAA